MKKRGMNNRGLSSIVITLILIVLSLIAIGVVWAVISNILKGGEEQTGLEKFTVNLDIKNAYEQEGNIIVNVLRTAGEGKIVKIKFIFSDGHNSETITVDSNLGVLDSDNFILNPLELISSEIATVSIAPVFSLSGGTESVGDITDTYNIISNTLNKNPLNDCTKNCGTLQCGLDPICGESCGTCLGTDFCTNGVCVPLNCVPDLIETTCGTWACGQKINNCGIEVTCPSSCVSGQMCNLGVCVDVISINEGIIEEVWPGYSGMYFGSTNLSTKTYYLGNYIKFFDSAETRCLLIAIYKFPVEGYLKSHIGFNFETLIKTGERYKIFSTSTECYNA